MTIRLYPFGFLLSDQPSKIDSIDSRGFTHTLIWNQIHAYIQPDEPCEVYGDSRLGVIWLGHATNANTSDDCSSPAYEAYEALMHSQEAFEEMLDYVVGRWACLVFVDGHSYVYNDMIACQPIYYHRKSFILSSHLPLLSEEIDSRENKSIEPFPLGAYKLWDETEDKRAGALPPNFRYELQSRELSRFYPPKDSTMFSEKDESEAIDEATRLVKNSVAYWQSLPMEKYCALTAGKDTRLVAAAALSVSKDFTFVTYGSTSAPSEEDGPTARSYKQDASVATEIAKIFSIPNIILPIEKSKEFPLNADEKKILASNFHGKHAINFQGLYENTVGVSPALCYIGIGFEAFREYYINPIQPLTDREIFTKMVNAIGGYSSNKRERELSPCELESMWKKYGLDTVVNSNFPLSNLLYLENRGGRFQSEAINCQSTAFLPINPIAIRKVFELAQLQNIYNRKNSRFAQLLITNLFPALSGIPANGQMLHTEAVKIPLTIDIRARNSRNESSYPFKQNLPDKIKLRRENLTEGGESFFRGEFSLVSGALKIELLNKYSIGREVSNVECFIRVNGTDLVSYPIGNHPEPFTLVIQGLTSGDVVDAGMRSMRTNGVAWSNVSTLTLLDWIETEGDASGSFRYASTRNFFSVARARS